MCSSRDRKISFLELPKLMAEAHKSANEYLRDAELLHKERSLSHAISLAILGIEELVKVLYAIKQYENNEGRFLREKQNFDITLPNWLFSGHFEKLKFFKSGAKEIINNQIEAMKFLGVEVKMNGEKRQQLQELFTTFGKVAKKGHKLRMGFTYTDYDSKRRQVKSKRVPTDSQLRCISILKGGVNFLQPAVKLYTIQADDFRQGNIPNIPEVTSKRYESQ